MSPPRIGPAPHCPATNESVTSVDLYTGFSEKSHAFNDLIRILGSHHRVPPRLIKAVVEQESQFNPRAVSAAGAQGLMQLMPRTARVELGVKDLLDPKQNLNGGTKYLATLLNQNDGNLRLALAAYNAGQANVDRHKGVPPFLETGKFVANILERFGCGSKVPRPDSFADQPQLVAQSVYAPRRR